MTTANIILITMLILVLLIIGISTYYIIKQTKFIMVEFDLEEKFRNKFNLLYTDIEMDGDSRNESDK